MPVTGTEYNAFEEAFDSLNAELLGGKLSDCLITLQSRGRTQGYYWSERFSNRNTETTTDEIALNPAAFEGQSDEEILSTLVHEMIHQYQFEYGNPGRGGYHNKEWAEMIMERGLMPTDTGKLGGKKTGQSVSHYIVEAGPFQLACRRLLGNGFKINWESCENGKTTSRAREKNKVEYACRTCGQNAWAKPRARLLCGVCYDETGEIVPMKDSDTKGRDVIAP